MGIDDYVLLVGIGFLVIHSCVIIIEDIFSWIERVYFPERIAAREEKTLAYLNRLLEEYQKMID